MSFLDNVRIKNSPLSGGVPQQTSPAIEPVVRQVKSSGFLDSMQFKNSSAKPSGAKTPGGIYVNRKEKEKPYSFTEELQLAGEQLGLSEKFETLSEEQKAPGFVSKVFDFLQIGEYASGGILSGKGVAAGIKEKITPSDALGIKNPFLGFATDVLLDPTTYLTFGAGSGVKVATKAGIKVTNNAGKKVLSDLITELGETAGREAFTKKLAEEGGESFLQKTGLKFMGTQIIPEKTVKFPFKVMNTVLEKTPVISPIYKGTKDVIEAGFKPFARIEKTLGEQGGAWIVGFQHFMKGGKAEIEVAEKQISDMLETSLVKFHEESREKISREAFGERIAKVIEYPESFDESETINSIASSISRQYKNIADEEEPRGLIRGVISNYQRHFLTPQAARIIEADPAGFADLVRPLGKESAEKGVEKTVKETAEGVAQKGTASVAKDGAAQAGIEALQKSHGPYQHRRIDGVGITAFKAKHGVDLFEKNAFTALSRRTTESIKARRLHDWYMGATENFGIAGVKTTKEIKDMTGVTKLIEKIEPQYVNGIKHVESNVPELRGMLFPEPIVQHLNDTHKFLTDDKSSKTFLNMYDNVLRFWKGSVTGWFPAFHTRNATGGVFNNWIMGLNNPLRYVQGNAIVRGADGNITTELGQKISYSQIREELEEHAVTGMSGQIDVQLKAGSMIKTHGFFKGVGVAFKEGEVKQTAKILGSGPVRMMEMVENNLRTPLYIHRRIKGDSPEMAAKAVIMAHFDYAPEAYTKFENDFMARIMPFYKWSRGNIPLQIEQMMKQPGKYAAVGKLIENIGEPMTQEQRDALPSYVKDGIYFKLQNSEEGFMTVMAGLGLPVEDLGKLWRGGFGETLNGLLTEFSPIIKYPIEIASGMNLFYGEEIEDLDYVKPWVSNVPGLRDWLEVAEYTKADGKIGYRGNPNKLHLMSSLVGRYYTTLGKATEENVSKFNRILNFATGARVKDYKLESEQYWRDQEFQEELIEVLHHHGVNVSEFKNLSVTAREELGLPTGANTQRKTEALIKELREKKNQ